MSNELSVQYQKRYEQFAGLTTRERALSLIAGLCIILLGGFVLYVEPLIQSLDKKQMELQRQTTQVADLSAQVASLSAKLSEDPDAPLIARLEELAKRNLQLDEQLAQRTEDLVPADRMPKLLGSMFAEFDTLQLVEMRSIKPKAMLQVDEKNSATEVNLYQHGVKLVLEGKYFDIQAYLNRVESLPWQFYWKKFHYQVDNYPQALVELEIYTFSTSKAFIGVAKDG